MGAKRGPPTEGECRYWRVYSALQELCGAEDCDVENDKMLTSFLKISAQAICTFREQKRGEDFAVLKRAVLKDVGIPMISSLKKK